MSGLDKFIITGTCNGCGELLGKLKPASGPMAGFPSINIYTNDSVTYHVEPSMTKTRIRCV